MRLLSKINRKTNFHAVRKVLLSDKVINGLGDGYKKYSNLKHTAQLVDWGIEIPISVSVV